MIINTVFSLLATLLVFYSILCSVRIVLTWIPGINNSFTDFLSRICDPYLNYFSSKGLLRFGQFDFSPLLSLGLLAFGSTICSTLAMAERLTIGFLLAAIVSMAWNVFSSIINFAAILLIIRFIVLLVQHNSYNGSYFWKTIDSFLNPFVYKVARIFSGRRMLSYKSTVLLTIFVLLTVSIAGTYGIGSLCSLIRKIPF